MTTLDDTILSVQRMARCSRYWARAARAVDREFRAEFDLAMSDMNESRDPTGYAQHRLNFHDLRTVTLDRIAEAEGHERDAANLEATVRRLEAMRTVLSSFRIDPPDADGDVWLKIEDQGDGRLAAFNLGQAFSPKLVNGGPINVRIAHTTALTLDQARQMVLGDDA